MTGVSFAPGMTNEATEPCSMTACVMARECKGPSAPGEVPEEVFSDGGSTPPASTILIAGRTPDDEIVVLPFGFWLVLDLTVQD